MSSTNFDGKWAGTNKLWFEDPNVPEESEATIAIDGNRVTYTWVFRGKPQSGVLTFKPDGHSVTAEWTDTWHSVNPMSAIGTIEPGQLSMLGHYQGGDEIWGWRIELALEDSRHLRMRMFNIEPKGDESIAVELTGRPA